MVLNYPIMVSMVANSISFLADKFLSQKAQQGTLSGIIFIQWPYKGWSPTGLYLGTPAFLTLYYLMLAISSSDVNMFADDTEIHFNHGDLSTVE